MSLADVDILETCLPEKNTFCQTDQSSKWNSHMVKQNSKILLRQTNLWSETGRFCDWDCQWQTTLSIRIVKSFRSNRQLFIFWGHTEYGPRREKTCLWGFANNTGADQPAHPRSLVSAFVIHVFQSNISKTCYEHNFNFLASLCSCAGWFESNFVGNPEDRFLSWRGPYISQQMRCCYLSQKLRRQETETTRIF